MYGHVIILVWKVYTKSMFFLRENRMGQKRQRHGDFDRLKHEGNSDFTNFTEDMDVSRSVSILSG